MWTDYLDVCLNKLKDLVAKNLVCKPIDGRLDVPIWVITDASATGAGALYGQGATWDTCVPAGYLSQKFTPAQVNYCTWEHELLAILEALMRWEDKLLGLPFMIVTDHQALTFFKEVPTGSQHRMRWREYLSQFDYKIQYLRGDKNLVADALSCYFASDEPGKSHGIERYVNADSHLDPEGDDLSHLRCIEVEELRANMCFIESPDKIAKDRVEHRTTEASNLDSQTEEKAIPSLNFRNSSLQDVLKSAPKLYPEDNFFSHIAENPEHYNKFELRKGIRWTRNRQKECVICIPKGTVRGKTLRGSLLDTCHRTLGHLGPHKMLEYVRHWFWWPLIAKDVEDFCKSCGPCQVSKPSRERPPGWVHTMPVPSQPWESVGMDFSGPYPEVKGFNYILLVICQMTNMVHIIPMRTDVMAKQVAELYVKEIVRLHGIPESVVSDWDTKFTSQFWTKLSHLLEQQL